MKTMVVTSKSNWAQDDDGKYEFDEEGLPVLLDEDHLGMVLNTHVLPISSLNTETKQLETLLIHRLEVAWNNDRCPALSLEDPNEVVFISLPDESDDEDDDESGFEDDPTDEENGSGERDVDENHF